MKQLGLNKLNRQLYALTFGPQTIPSMAKKISKKTMCLNYKQYKRILHENDGMVLQSMMVGEQCPTVVELMDSPLDNYNSISTNKF